MHPGISDFEFSPVEGETIDKNKIVNFDKNTIFVAINIIWRSSAKREDRAISLVRKPRIFKETGMIVQAHSMLQYRVGLYQLIGFGRFAVPLTVRRGPPYIFRRSPMYHFF